MYSVTDVIATCGGLLGLFMGISLLGFIEMIVYCAIRFAYKISRKRRYWNLNQKRVVTQPIQANVVPPVV